MGRGVAARVVARGDLRRSNGFHPHWWWGVGCPGGELGLGTGWRGHRRSGTSSNLNRQGVRTDSWLRQSRAEQLPNEIEVIETHLGAPR